MDLYLNKKLESIPIYQILLTLINKFEYSEQMIKNLLQIGDIYDVKHLYDPVEDFLEYYINSSNIPMNDGRKQYIINALYAAKGDPIVFDIFEEVFEVKLTYNWPFPKIELIEFDPLKINDVELFIKKMTSMLYYLIYYTELIIHIKNLTLSLQGDLIQYTGGLIVGYKLHDITDMEYELIDK